MAEWFKAAVLKTVEPLRVPGFESLFLRQNALQSPTSTQSPWELLKRHFPSRLMLECGVLNWAVYRKFLKDAMAVRVGTSKSRVPINAGSRVSLVEGLKPTGNDTIQFRVPGNDAVLEMPSDEFRDVTERID